MFKTPEFEQREAAAAARLHHADFCKSHPELTTGLHPTIAQAFAPLMFRSVVKAVAVGVEQAAAHRAATGDNQFDQHDEYTAEPMESVICGGCNGSGEGSHDGSTCRTCGGEGEVLEAVNAEDAGIAA